MKVNKKALALADKIIGEHDLVSTKCPPTMRTELRISIGASITAFCEERASRLNRVSDSDALSEDILQVSDLSV